MEESELYVWKYVEDGAYSSTEMMMIPEGTLYRTTTWEGGNDALSIAMVFVPKGADK